MILDTISNETGVRMSELVMICYTANRRYRNYTIPKRTGGRRQISHPTPELKFLQRWLNKNVFFRLPIHRCAYAYRKGRNIADNARLHVGNNYLLKVDFSNFFPSLRDTDVERVLKQNLTVLENLVQTDIDIIKAIVCKDRRLTIGAPSSPPLSNAIMYDFDEWAAKRARESGILYSRYADDLFFSTEQPGLLTRMLEDIRKDLQERTSPKLKINDRKTAFTSGKHRKVVAGMTLGSDGKISVGRKKKREVRTLMYLYSEGKLVDKEVSYLRGYLGFMMGVERDFMNSIELKFGKSIIDQVMKEGLVKRK